MGNSRLHGLRLFLSAILISISVSAIAAVEKGKNPYPAEWFWGNPKQRAYQDKLIGRRLPDLEVREWVNGEPGPWSLKGKIIVLDLWATWCGPCLEAIPRNNATMEKYKDKGVVIIGICTSGSGQSRMADVVAERGAKYLNAKDYRGEMAEVLRLQWWPTYVVADREGIIRAIGLQTGRADAVVDAILAEEAVEESDDSSTTYHDPGMELDTPTEEAIAAGQDQARGPDAAPGSPDAAAAVEIKRKAYPADWFWGEAAQRERQDELIGSRLPELNVTGWINGELNASQLEGKIVVIDLWATWSGACFVAIPRNNAMMEKFKDQGVVIVGICGSNRGQERMAEVAQAGGAKYPIAKDSTGKMAESFRLMWWPTYVVVDRGGIIRAVGLKSGYVENVVEAILADEEYKRSDAASSRAIFEMEGDPVMLDAPAAKMQESTPQEVE